MKNSRSNYADRINRVTDYLRAHLDESPSLEELADVACLSSFHFHRLFTAITGETVNKFTTRHRLEKAARLLKYSRDSITNVALECGFSSSSTFSRGFKSHFHISPSAFRKNGKLENSKNRKDFFPIHEYSLSLTKEELKKNFPVEIRAFPERRVAFIRVVGAYEEDRVPRALRKLEEWAKQNGLFEDQTIFGMSLDDPSVTPRDKYRYETCVTVPESLEIEDNSISEMKMPACDYAVISVSGDLKLVTTGLDYLLNTWLLESNFEPEHSPALEIFRNKENLYDWEHLELDICLPVKPLVY